VTSANRAIGKGRASIPNVTGRDTSGQWVLAWVQCKLTGLRPNVCVQYERVSGLDARITAKPLTDEPGFVQVGLSNVMGD
jgi:hypothetical protein